MIHLHQLMHAVTTSIGLRPRPSTDPSRLVPVPVMIALHRPGEDKPYAVVPCEAFAAFPYRPEKKDEHSNIIAAGQMAEVVLACVIPEELNDEGPRQDQGIAAGEGQRTAALAQELADTPAGSA